MSMSENIIKKNKNSNKHKGFTLIELLISLTIVAVLLTFAVPMGRDFLMKNTLAAQTEEVVSALHYVRHQAAILGKTLKLTQKPEGWSSGMLLLDESENKNDNNNDTILFQWQWDNPDITITWHGIYPDYILFTPIGLNSVLAGSFYICPVNMSSLDGNIVSMNRLGRIKVEADEKVCNT